MGFWDGLISGFNKASAAGRAEAQAKADQEFARTSAILTRLSQDDVDPAIRTAATSAMFEMAAGQKAPKGGFLQYLTGTQTPPSYPGVEAVMKMLGPQHVPGLTVTTPTPLPPPAQAPSGASGAMVRGAGGPSSPSQLTTPPPPAPVGGPPSLGNVQPGVIPSTLTAGTPHQTAGATAQPHVFKTKAELDRETAIAKAQGDIEGDRAGLLAAGFSDAEIRDIVKRHAIGRIGTTARDSYAEGETIQHADGSWWQTLYNRYDPTDQIEIPATAPAAKSIGAPSLPAQVAHELFGNLYPGLLPTEVLNKLSPGQRTQLDAVLRQRAAATAGAVTTARGNAANITALDKPLTVPEATQAAVPIGTTLRAMAGIVPTTPAHRQQLQAATTLAGNIEKIQGLLPQVFPADTGVVGTGLSLWWQQKQADPDYRDLEALINSSLALTSEIRTDQPGSRLSDKDVELMKGALAQLQGGFISHDTLESATRVMGRLGQEITNWQQRLANQNSLAPGGVGSTPPPPGPGVGSFVGQVYAGERRQTTDGRILGKLDDGRVVELLEHNGQWYVK